MKDASVKAMFGMACLTCIYSVFIIGSVCAGQPIPDGPLLISMGAGIGALGGGLAVADALKKR